MFKQSTLMIFCLFCIVSAAMAQEPKAGDIVFEPTMYTPSKGDAVEAEQGSLWVPANRSKPNGDLYKLAFIRFKSTSDAPGAPIVYLAGRDKSDDSSIYPGF